MLGGYQILDLRGIDLTISQSASDITNANVLNQLLKLRDYIDKAYNFSKPLENQLKPVLIRFRDKKANEKIEGATFGELSVVDNYYSFKITARLSGVLVLTINVTFEEVENGYGNYEWVIDDATIQLADETQTITGDLTVEGDLSVDGSFEQKDCNWESSNLEIDPNWLNGLTAHNSFVKIAKVNKELHVIISAELENETAESITTGSNLSIIALSNIPSEIASKIYRKDGTNCSQAYTDSDVILSSPISFSDINGLNYEQKCGLLYSNNPGVLALWLAYGINITIGASQKKFIDYRVQILL